MYTKAQIKDLVDYLNYAVKEGYADETFATEVLKAKDWKLIDEMRDRADNYASDPEYQERSDVFKY